MSAGAAVVLSLLLAVVIVGALSKPGKTFIHGLMVKGKDGSIGLKILPAKKGKKRGRRK